MSSITAQRLFLPTKDFARSIEFYVRMGWQLRFRDETLAFLELGAAQFLLQDYYHRQWAENTMVHLTVDDAETWFKTAERVKAEGAFETVAVRAPQRAPYGAMVTLVVDPAGILLHFAAFGAEAQSA